MKSPLRGLVFWTLAIGLALPLVTPGLAGAEEESVQQKLRALPLPSSGGQCSASSNKAAQSFEALKAILIREQLAAAGQAPGSESSDGVLNNRGYNYGPEPTGFDIVTIQREVEMQRRVAVPK